MELKDLKVNYINGSSIPSERCFLVEIAYKANKNVIKQIIPIQTDRSKYLSPRVIIMISEAMLKARYGQFEFDQNKLSYGIPVEISESDFNDWTE